MIQSLAHHSPVRRLCRLLEVSPSGYYQWRRPRHGPRHRANQQLLERIRKAFEQNHQTYGSPRITRLLQRQHIPCSQNRVARLMRRHGLKARSKRPFRPRTTDSRHLYRAAPNRLKAQTLTRINQAWVADITYLRAGSRWIYLAAVMDLFSRRIVGWSLGYSLHALLVQEALQHALAVKATTLRVYSDSEIVVKQMSGEYSCRSPRLYSLNWTCRKLARSMDFSILHIPRENNREANRLANHAARSGKKPSL